MHRFAAKRRRLLARIATQTRVEPIAPTMPPDLLARVIDHLGYVLADDTTWQKGCDWWH